LGAEEDEDDEKKRPAAKRRKVVSTGWPSNFMPIQEALYHIVGIRALSQRGTSRGNIWVKSVDHDKKSGRWWATGHRVMRVLVPSTQNQPARYKFEYVAGETHVDAQRLTFMAQPWEIAEAASLAELKRSGFTSRKNASPRI
jgi:hypothetical protein